VAKFAGSSMRAAANFTVQDEACANASANSHHDSILRTHRSTSAMFGNSGACRVVVGHNWQADPLGEKVLNRQILKRQVS